MNLKDIDWRDIVRTTAPTLATVLTGGNPLAGMAVKAISETLLGRPDGTEADVETAILGAGADDLLKLKEADNQFKLDMRRADIDLEKVHAGDRDSARKREVATGDWTNRILAAIYTLGYFWMLYYFMKYAMPEGNKDFLLPLLGVMTGGQVLIMQYYFGSSKGSSDKNVLLKR